MPENEKRPNLADPDFEPSDEQMAQLMRDAMADVRARAAAAASGQPPAPKAAPEPENGSGGR